MSFDPKDFAIFFAFFIPGFISSQIYGLFIGVDDSDFSKRLPAVIGYSAVHYALTGWLILVAPPGPWQIAAAYFVVFVIPIFWPFVILLIRDPGKWRHIFLAGKKRKIVRRIFEAMLTPEAMPWDRTLDASARYIRIRLKSGRFVGGYFGDGSSVSTFPSDRQIFISQAYTFDVNGEFGNPVPDTGVLVQGDEIESLETVDP